MRQKIDLLNGPVFPSLAKLAVPIMATSLVQMAYNLTDMIWIGRIGSNAVASVALPECICGLQWHCRPGKNGRTSESWPRPRSR